MGHCEISNIKDTNDRVQIQFQNENLLVQRNGRTLAIVPDLISVVDRETAQPIIVEALKFGQRVKVIGTSAAPIMRSPEVLTVFDPAGFGNHFSSII